MAKISQINGNVWYWCPGCNSNHRIVFRGDYAWTWNGDFDKPTFSPSVLVNRDNVCPTVPVCHHFVQDGKIQYLSDCSHSMAGQTVEMEDFDGRLRN